MSGGTYDLRPGEVLLQADRTFLATSKFDLDASGRHIPIGILADTPTIVGAAEGAAISEMKSYARVVKGDRGVLPPRYSAGDSAGQDKFLGRTRTPTRTEQVRDLLENEMLGPVSRADSTLKLIEAGVFDRSEAIAWARETSTIAVLSGTGNKEPWVPAAKKLIDEK